MKVDDMILVIENDKGSEKNTILNFEDYLKFVGADRMDGAAEVAECVRELCSTKTDKSKWAKVCFKVNHSVQAKYCYNEQMLTSFVYGYLNEDREWGFSSENMSKDCERKLRFLGYDSQGKISRDVPHYEKMDTKFKAGDILHNFNGSDYRVMELYSEKNMLLMNMENGKMVVGKGVSMYARCPSGESVHDPDAVTGIEWDHGIYLSDVCSAIDFKQLKENYKAEEEELSAADKTDKEYMVEITETLSRLEKMLAPDPAEAISRVQERYENEDIILAAEDIKGVSFDIYKEESRGGDSYEKTRR